MSRRRAVVIASVTIATMLIHLLLVRLMAHGHVAHVLLGSANQAPPIRAALLASALVLVRFAAIVLGPGALLASAVSLVAHALVGPKRGGGSYRDGADAGAGGADGADDGDGAADDGDAGTGTNSGTGIHSDEEGSGGVDVAEGTA